MTEKTGAEDAVSFRVPKDSNPSIQGAEAANLDYKENLGHSGLYSKHKAKPNNY